MKKTVLVFITLALFATWVSGVWVPAADAADVTDSTYWNSRIDSIAGSDLPEKEKAFKIKLIREYMGDSSKTHMVANLVLVLLVKFKV